MSEAATKLKGGEAICAKAADNVATIWETLVEDDATEKIRQRIHETDECITVVKVDMQKMPLQQKVLSTQMALLHPSADTSYAGTQKDIYGLKVVKTL